MLTVKDVQDEVRRINLEVLVHNGASEADVADAIVALNEVTVEMAPLVGEYQDLLALEKAFQPCGSMSKADDPGMVWVRFPRVEFETMRAMAESIQTRRHLADKRQSEPTVTPIEIPYGVIPYTIGAQPMSGYEIEWMVGDEVVQHGGQFWVTKEHQGKTIRLRQVKVA